jgi:AraC-like DNA-binding protein
MPKMSGLAMVEQIKDSTNAKFIILSGYDEFNYAKKAINLGASGYLLKPIDDDEFEEVLKNTVEKIKAEKQNVVVENPADAVNLLQEGFKDKYISQACQVMRKRLHEELTLKMVADELHISESYLGKLFKNKTSYTFLDVLTLYRIRAAIDYLEEMGLEVIKEKEDALTRYFYENIRHIDGIRIYGDPEGSHGPIVALNLPNMDSATLADCLAEDYGIATRPGAHCAPLMHKALGTDTQGLVRFSFSHFNTYEEVDLAVTALKELRQQD